MQVNLGQALKKYKDGKRRCYPKDVNALVQACIKVGYNPKLIQQVLDSNDEFLKLNK